MSKLGLASGLLRHTDYTIQRKLLYADQNLFMTTLASKPLTLRQELEGRLQVLSHSLQEKLEHMKMLKDERKALFYNAYPSWTSRSHAENEGDRRLVASIEAAVLRKVAKMSMGYRKDNYQNPMVSFRRDLICLAGDFSS